MNIRGWIFEKLGDGVRIVCAARPTQVQDIVLSKAEWESVKEFYGNPKLTAPTQVVKKKRGRPPKAAPKLSPSLSPSIKK